MGGRVVGRSLKFSAAVAVILALGSLRGLAAEDPTAAAPAAYVNPFIGTDKAEHTVPGATSPFGLVQLSPDTGGNKGLYLRSDWKWCAGYHYSDSSILGFSHLHRSGMGVGEWGDILFMPYIGDLRLTPGEPDRPGSGYRSRFRHETEAARPGYYRVLLDDYGILAELTVAPRSGLHRYTFPASNSAHILIDLARGLGDAPLVCNLRIVGRDRIIGTRTSTGLLPFHKVHFCAQFSRPFDSFGVWNGKWKKPGVRFEVGSRIGAFVNYRTHEGETILAKVGLSFTSEEEACKNLAADQTGFDFDGVAAAAGAAWDRELSRVQVLPSGKDSTEISRRRLAVFYTALYHAFLFPALFSDADGVYSVEGNVPGINKHADGFDYYSEFSVWDTFRAEMPLLMLIQPRRATDMVKTMLRQYRDSGWLPSPNQFGNFHSEGMIGDPAAIVIYDAYLKGLDFDRDLAYRALAKNATWPAVNIIPMIFAGVGRWGNVPYMKLGYVPADFALPPKNPLFIAAYAFNQGVSRTLEYAYADFCVAGMAAATGRQKEAEYFLRRSQNYRRLFDPATGFMRGKSVTGRWMNARDYNPAAYYGYYTEGNGWQWTWSVFHDVAGLIELMGGPDRFNDKLDAFFAAGTSVEAYDLFSVHIGGQIGQYAHGNEPSHHIAYLYDYSGQPWKTQKLARQIMDDMYGDAPHGLAGNEDMGQMSAWYVFSALGLYPFAPGIYLIGSPLFERAELTLENGARIVVEAENVSMTNKYIQSATLNGAALDRPWIRHAEIAQGAVLHFRMGPEPNREWGSAPEDAPPSFDRLYGETAMNRGR
jgi:predicted alpha-1,2-mannosidase